jgi:hypothetical protein
MANVPLVAHHAEPGLLSAERLHFLDSSSRAIYRERH